MPSRTVAEMLPHDLEAEAAVLGSALASPEAWPRVAVMLAAGDFYRHAHRLVYGAMAALAAAGTPIDLLTVTSTLKTQRHLEDVGGPAYVSSLTDGVPRHANVSHYAEIVREHSRRRSLAGVGAWIVETSAGPAETRTVVSEAAQRLASILATDQSGLVSADDAVAEYAGAIASGAMAKPMETGYADLDVLLGGVRPSELVIVAARPSVGKTSFALGLAVHMAQRGDSAVFFSLEMSARGLAARLLSWRTRVSALRVERGDATELEYASVVELAGGMKVGPLRIEDTARTLVEVNAWCERARIEFGLGCVIVDYLQLLSPDRRSSSQESDVAEISRGLKRIAKAFDVPVVALSQLSRAPETRRDKRPHLSDLRSSGALEQDADLVLLLFRPEMYGLTPENAGVAEVIVAKNRSGPTGTVRLQFEASLAEFRNLAYQYGEGA